MQASPFYSSCSTQLLALYNLRDTNYKSNKFFVLYIIVKNVNNASDLGYGETIQREQENK